MRGFSFALKTPLEFCKESSKSRSEFCKNLTKSRSEFCKIQLSVNLRRIGIITSVYGIDTVAAINSGNLGQGKVVYDF